MKIIPASVQRYADKAIETMGKAVPASAQKLVSSPKIADFVENTFFAVSVETALKAVGRPTFIMLDKEADSQEKKKYAATKEVLYQGLCLVLYLGALPFLKKELYKGISSWMQKSDFSEVAEKVQAFNKEKDLIKEAEKAYQKTGSYMERLLSSLGIKKNAAINAAKAKLHQAERAFKQKIHNNDNLKFGRGITEVSAIIGSIIMLTVVAPQISHFIIHPIMNALGFDKQEGGGH